MSMKGKKRIYFCDSTNKRIVDIYIVQNHIAGGDVYMKYHSLYGGMVHQLSWSMDSKYLKEHGFK